MLQYHIQDYQTLCCYGYVRTYVTPTYINIYTAVIESDKLHMLYHTVHINEVTCQITQGKKDIH
jgi:hypothetical protein